MKKLIYLVAVAFFISCGQATPNDPAVTTASTVVDGNEMTEAKLTITGMTCAAGCGGKIQKELQALDGVQATNLDFVEEREENVVTVNFDPKKVTEQRMQEVVNTIADGAYHVVKSEVITHKAS